MSQEAKQEMIRRQFVKESHESNFEENFVREIVFIAKDMGGWSIESILEMPILRYNEVRNAIRHQYDEQRREMEMSKNRKTFR